jgi:hypothetical protein
LEVALSGVNASIISSSWVRLIYVEFCEITRAITTKSEHTDHWTKMLRPFALFSGSVPSRHIRSSAGFIITTCVFEFSVHTGQFAGQQSRAAHVRFGSKCDMHPRSSDVRSYLLQYQTSSGPLRTFIKRVTSLGHMMLLGEWV